MELAALRSIVSDRRSGVIGFPAASRSPRFRGTSRPPRPPSPASCEAGSSSRERSSPSEFLSPHPPATSRLRAPSMGFGPLRDISLRSPRSRAIPSPLRSALGVSHPLDGLLLHRPCRFISPCSHVRDSPFRGFPSSEATPPRRWQLPSCRLTAPAVTDLRRRRHRHGPVFRALLLTGVRCATQVVSLRYTRSPPGLRLLRVLRPPAVPALSCQLRS